MPKLHKVTAITFLASAFLLSKLSPQPIVSKFQFRSMSYVPPQSPPNWKLNTDDINRITQDYISKGNELDDLIAGVTNPTIDSVLKPYAEFENTYSGISNEITFYQHVSPNKELRDASTDAEQKIRDFGIESGLREDVYKVFNKLYESVKDQDIDFETKRYIKKINDSYRRNGLGLPIEERNKVKEIQKKLSNLSLEFSKNLGENSEFLLFTKEELNGVPDDVINQFEKIDDKLKMTFKYPDLFPVLKYAKNSNTRKLAFVGDQNKNPENEKLLIEAVDLRTKLASILGYKNFSDYVLEERMAKNTTTVLNFLNDLKDKLIPLGLKEKESLLELKKKDLISQNLEFDNNYYVWDHRFYDNLLLEKEYKVDQQKLSEFFPMEHTVSKMLNFYETLFKLKFIEVKEDKSTWHDDVKQFSVWKLDNPKNPSFVGWIYFDLWPRDNKYNHAANFGLHPGFIKADGSRSYPITALVCNFSKPTKDKPPLLKHDEVTTFFHELGHGIHDLVGDVQYARFHGPSAVSWDFVEAPSQMLEYWTWSKNELKELSSHYLTREQIDDELIDSLIKSKHVNGGLFNLRQLHFGLFDMTLHSNNSKIDITKFWNESRQEIALVSNGDSVTKGFNSFGHIMGGYQAGYFGYLWSQVFAADIYYTKFKNDPLNSETGIQYRDIILARGGSRDEDDNLKELLGREPNNEAFSKELGLK